MVCHPPKYLTNTPQNSTIQLQYINYENPQFHQQSSTQIFKQKSNTDVKSVRTDNFSDAKIKMAEPQYRVEVDTECIIIPQYALLRNE